MLNCIKEKQMLDMMSYLGNVPPPPKKVFFCFFFNISMFSTVMISAQSVLCKRRLIIY